MPEQLYSLLRFSHPLLSYDHTASVEYMILQIIPFSQCVCMYLGTSPPGYTEIISIYLQEYMPKYDFNVQIGF